MAERFKDQLREFEQERDALERIRQASNAMEKRQSEKKGSPPQHEDLDVVPTKETNRSQKSQKSTASSKKATQ